MEKDEKSERVVEKKRKQGVWFTTFDGSSILYIQGVHYSSWSIIITLWSENYPTAEIKVKRWLWGSYPEPLTKWSSPQGSRTIWGPTGDRWLIVQFVRPQMGLNITAIWYSLPPQIALSRQLYASNVAHCMAEKELNNFRPTSDNMSQIALFLCLHPHTHTRLTPLQLIHS